MLSDLQHSPILTPILTCSSQRFTGKLEIVARAGEPWSLYYQFGRLIWVTGGVHAVRRWRRAFNRYCPELQLNRFRFRQGDRFKCWDYHLFKVLLERRHISREQANAIASTVMEDVLFDLMQEATISTLISTHYSDETLPESGILLQPTLVVERAQNNWKAWCNSVQIDISPNLAPILRHPTQLREKTSATVYKKMSAILNGRSSLRDLAIFLKQDFLRLTVSLKSYIEQGTIELVEIPDLKKPVFESNPASATVRPPRDAVVPGTPCQISVACIDDSPQTCERMEQILTAYGYCFIGISDPVQALPILIERQPDVIFLDLVMPIANGYEICTQIRRVSTLKDIPVIMLTSRDGLVDRVRAQMVKATGFLSKPIEAKKVIAQVQKFVSHKALLQEPSEISQTGVLDKAVNGNTNDISYLGTPQMRPTSASIAPAGA